MELTYITIIVLACMIFVLSGMIGYLYWQQTRILQQVQSLSMMVASVYSQYEESEPEAEPEPEPALEVVPEHKSEVGEEEEDDRVSVEHIDGPEETTAETEAEDDVDDLQTKTAIQLRELLTKKGIPFGKRDSKTVLLQLLKATA